MAAVREGKVALFGAGGPVGAAAARALRDHYTLRLTDRRPLAEIIAENKPQSPDAPLPDAAAASLAPYLAELILREFVRAEAMVGVCLRFGDLGAGPADTTPEDAVSAIRKALTMDLAGYRYRWWLYHICSTDRYPLGHAAGRPLSFERGGG